MADLRETIEPIVREAVTENGDTEGLVIGECLLLAAANGWDADGNEISQVIVIPEGGSESRILGLLEHARATLRHDITAGDEWR